MKEPRQHQLQPSAGEADDQLSRSVSYLFIYSFNFFITLFIDLIVCLSIYSCIYLFIYSFIGGFSWEKEFLNTLQRRNLAT